MTDTTAITTRARDLYDTKQIALIQSTVAKDCSTAELHMFLELAARYELDPFAGQIYAVKMPGKNGGRGRVTIITSRDGFLTIANRFADFEGMEGDVVREKDTFRRTPDGTIEHSYEGSTAARGAIAGAWAKVYRKDRHPTYFYAPWEEYGGTKNTWGEYPSAMILKCAEATALRKAFSISGLVGEEEIARQRVQERPSQEPELDWGDEDDLPTAERLRALVAVLNQADPSAWRPAKLRMRLQGLGSPERQEFARELEDEILQKGLTMPEPEVVDGEAEEV